MKNNKINLNDEMDMCGVANAKELKLWYEKKIKTEKNYIISNEESIARTKEKIKHLKAVIKEVDNLKKKKPKLAFWRD